MMKTSLILAAFLAIAFISCNTTDGGLPPRLDTKHFAGKPYIIGKITNIDTKRIGEMSYLSVLVEENPDVHEPQESGGSKVSFIVSESTEILLQKRNGDILNFQKSELKKHQIVGGWTSGVVMTSYPAQAGADLIVVID